MDYPKEYRPTVLQEQTIEHELRFLNGAISDAGGRVSISVDRLTKTIDIYSKSTEQLSKRTYWLNIVIAIAAAIGGIKVFFDIYVHFTK